MARMYPEKLPQFILDDRRLGGERKVYKALEAGLPDEYTVLYRAHFCLYRGGGGVREKEVDFLVIHKGKGLLALEVKGGGIRVNNGSWTSVDGTGVEHEIENPGRQACQAAHDLASRLKSLPKWGNQPIAIGYAVIFPDCLAGQLTDAAIPKDCLLDEGGLDRILGFVEGAYKRHQRDLPLAESITRHRLQILIDHFAPTFETRTPVLLRSIRDGEDHISRLSEQQFKLLDFFMENRRYRIIGSAGTGKSVLALEAARRFAARGMRTLFVCFNRNLASHLRDSIGQGVEFLDVYTFHHLCSTFAEKAGMPLPSPDSIPPDNHREFFEKDHPDALLAALDVEKSWRFDAIVVDEAQDFMDDWWVSLQLTLDDPEKGAMYIFYDDSQGIFRETPKFLSEITAMGILSENYRNALPIHDLLKKRFGVKTTPRGPDTGPTVRWTLMGAGQKAPSAVSSALGRLIREEKIPPGNIVVLTGCSLKKTPLGNEGHIGGFRVTEDPSDGRKVLLSSIHSFKGLDKEAVILCELEGLVEQDRDQVLYVGISRARQYLEVIAKENVITNLQRVDFEAS